MLLGSKTAVRGLSTRIAWKLVILLGYRRSPEAKLGIRLRRIEDILGAGCGHIYFTSKTT